MGREGTGGHLGVAGKEALALTPFRAATSTRRTTVRWRGGAIVHDLPSCGPYLQLTLPTKHAAGLLRLHRLSRPGRPENGGELIGKLHPIFNDVTAFTPRRHSNIILQEYQQSMSRLGHGGGGEEGNKNDCKNDQTFAFSELDSACNQVPLSLVQYYVHRSTAPQIRLGAARATRGTRTLAVGRRPDGRGGRGRRSRATGKRNERGRESKRGNGDSGSGNVGGVGGGGGLRTRNARRANANGRNTLSTGKYLP
ncbi:hypothetical protein DL765_005149 [Monosporascus sp. GIB2]|nr:hypothetical protein DL765_005149 [Monosporascus sp. GIB2]